MDLFRNGKMAAYSSNCYGSHAPIDCFKENLGKSITLASDITGEPSAQRIDAEHWLPQAAEHYQISRNLKDYIIIPVPVIISDVPNTNGVAMPKNELLKFNTEHGQLAYKTFKGKPTHLEHDNQDMTKAKGAILDSFVNPLVGYGRGLIKVVLLLSFDRDKDPDLCNDILTGNSNSYSMGAYFNGYKCSLCGRGRGECFHTDPTQALKQHKDGTLIYRNIHDIQGFECSSVGSPAYISAISDRLLGVNC